MKEARKPIVSLVFTLMWILYVCFGLSKCVKYIWYRKCKIQCKGTQLLFWTLVKTGYKSINLYRIWVWWILVCDILIYLQVFLIIKTLNTSNIIGNCLMLWVPSRTWQWDPIAHDIYVVTDLTWVVRHGHIKLPLGKHLHWWLVFRVLEGAMVVPGGER